MHYAGKIDISDYWAVGDSRKVEFSNTESYVASSTSNLGSTGVIRILGFNHDNLETNIGNVSKAAVTFQFDILFQNGVAASSIISSTTIANRLYSSTYVRDWCNNSFINYIPSDLKDLIKPITKITNRICHNNYSKYRSQEITVDKMFLLSHYEVWGLHKVSDSEYGTTDPDGEQYDYMKTTTNRGKTFWAYGPVHWWLRNQAIYKDGGWCMWRVSDDDGVVDNDYDIVISSLTASGGIAPAFCI